MSERNEARDADDAHDYETDAGFVNTRMGGVSSGSLARAVAGSQEILPLWVRQSSLKHPRRELPQAPGSR